MFFEHSCICFNFVFPKIVYAPAAQRSRAPKGYCDIIPAAKRSGTSSPSGASGVPALGRVLRHTSCQHKRGLCLGAEKTRSQSSLSKYDLYTLCPDPNFNVVFGEGVQWTGGAAWTLLRSRENSKPRCAKCLTAKRAARCEDGVHYPGVRPGRFVRPQVATLKSKD